MPVWGFLRLRAAEKIMLAINGFGILPNAIVPEDACSLPFLV